MEARGHEDPPVGDGRRIRRLATLFYGGLLVAALLWQRLRTGHWQPGFARDGDWMASLGMGLLLAAAVIAATGPLMRRFALLRTLSREMRALLGPVSGPTAAHLAIVSALGEEIFFRGAMQPAIGYLATSVVFGLVHVGPDRRFLAWTGFAVVMGFGLGAIPLATGNLWGAVLAHGLINGVNLYRLGRLPPPEDPAEP